MQEVALRAYLAWSDETIATSFAGWCAGTARHVSADLWRRRPHEPLSPEVLDLTSGSSTEELVEGSLSLVGFSRAWNVLSPAEREALMSAAPEGATKAELNRFYVGLHRLRNRTRELAESFTPAVLGIVERVRDVLGIPGLEAASAVIAVAAGLTVGSLVQTAVPSFSAPVPAVEIDRAITPAVSTRVSASVPPVRVVQSPRRDATLTRGLRPPLQQRAEARLPDGRSAYGEVWRGDPYEPPPLWCGDVTGVVQRICVDYPVRP